MGTSKNYPALSSGCSCCSRSFVRINLPTMTARHLAACSSLMFLPTGLLAQVECDAISIASIRYSAFDPSIVEVRTLNSGEGFSYPWLILFDANGDTVAWAPMDFFWLGPDQTFLLLLTAGTIPVGPFPATVELWAANDLVCTFQLEADLCPPTPCSEVYPFVIDQSGNTGGHMCDWVVVDINGFPVATGSSAIPVGSTQTRDTVCLAPGTYSLSMTEVSGTGQDLQFWMEGSEWWSSPTSPHVWIDSAMVSPFVLYEPCIDGANAITEMSTVGLGLNIVNGLLNVRGPVGTTIRNVEVMDAAGRLLRTASGTGAALDVDITDLAPAVLVIRATDNAGARSCRTIISVE